MVKVLGEVSYVFVWFKYRGTSLRKTLLKRKTKDWLKSIICITRTNMRKRYSGKSRLFQISLKSFGKN